MVTKPLCYRRLDEELGYFRFYTFLINREEQMENVMMEGIREEEYELCGIRAGKRRQLATHQHLLSEK